MRAKLMVLILAGFLSGLLAPATSWCNGEEATIEFPYVLRIARGNVLFVHGHEFRDSVTFTWEPGDSLRIESMAVLPAPPFHRAPMSEENLAKTYARVPFIVERVEEGLTWREAAEEWRREQDTTVSDMSRVYRTVLDSTGSHHEAEAAALRAVDRTLLEPGRDPSVSEGMIKMPWAGSLSEIIFIGRRRTWEKEPVVPQTTEERAVGLTKSLSKNLDGRRGVPWVVAIDRRGRTGVSGEGAEEALHQVDLARRGQFIKGPLDKTMIREITARTPRKGGERR